MDDAEVVALHISIETVGQFEDQIQIRTREAHNQNQDRGNAPRPPLSAEVVASHTSIETVCDAEVVALHISIETVGQFEFESEPEHQKMYFEPRYISQSRRLDIESEPEHQLIVCFPSSNLSPNQNIRKYTLDLVTYLNQDGWTLNPNQNIRKCTLNLESKSKPENLHTPIPRNRRICCPIIGVGVIIGLVGLGA